MIAPLKDCITLKQRAVIRFLNAEGIQTSQICQRMKNIYGESCLSQKNIYKWVNKLKNGRITCSSGLNVWPDVDGPICLDFLSSRQRMNSDLYCDILVNKLKPGIRNKKRGKLSKVLEHPAYSPNLAHSNYFLFGLLKKELKGKRFDSDEDVQKVVQDFFHTLPKSAYKEGIYKLPERWRRRIESQGCGCDFLLWGIQSPGLREHRLRERIRKFSCVHTSILRVSTDVKHKKKHDRGLWGRRKESVAGPPTIRVIEKLAGGRAPKAERAVSSVTGSIPRREYVTAAAAAARLSPGKSGDGLPACLPRDTQADLHC
ncbi:hypothetical protein LAZ67_18000238 [Cordylochernes scorpioides]|uniref:Transposase n=1 Tax=Cordylochernes scorpioides TaxID=51811 RepID=A0ABY6LF48_9ARAC|nr:hypothetical protein LAZ67_18000238 [Cordylochernes scorpioides]